MNRRTNIVLNDELVKEAFQYVSVSTKRELIEIALEEFVKNHRRWVVRELRGNIQISPDYNYKKSRDRDRKYKSIVIPKILNSAVATVTTQYPLVLAMT